MSCLDIPCARLSPFILDITSVVSLIICYQKRAFKPFTHYSLLPFTFLNFFQYVSNPRQYSNYFHYQAIATRQVKTSVTAPNTTRRVMTFFTQFFFNCIQIYIDSKVYTSSVFKSQIFNIQQTSLSQK